MRVLLLMFILTFQVTSYAAFKQRLNRISQRILAEVQKDLCKKSRLFKHTERRIQDTYAALHQKCKLKEIVPIFTSNALAKNIHALYNPYHHCIVTSEMLKTTSPSYQIAVLLHELRHAKQHEKKIKLNKIQQEADADYFAYSTIQCPICLMICSHYACDTNQQGYATKMDILQLMRHNQSSHKHICADHQYNAWCMQKILHNIHEQAKDELIVMLDTKYGNILNRLPKF